MDLSGAQHGYYQPVRSFGEYLTTHCRTISIPVHPYFGGTRDHPRELAKSGVSGENLLRLNDRISKIPLKAMTIWEEKREMTGPQLLASSQNIFEHGMKDLVAALGTGIDIYLRIQKEADDKFIAEVVAGRIKVKGDGIEIDPAQVS